MSRLEGVEAEVPSDHQFRKLLQKPCKIARRVSVAQPDRAQSKNLVGSKDHGRVKVVTPSRGPDRNACHTFQLFFSL